MDLDRMLAKCVSDQWDVADIDWSRPPPALSREREEAVVQYFTDMAAIERLAGALFEEQRRRSTDPRLQHIFASFVRDEVRHSQVAQRLADHYDVHHYRVYQPNAALQKFTPAFVHALQFLSAEYATTYITTGELILDVALLRSLDDYMQDATCSDVMRLINRDESRHIAVDFHMIAYYASEAYQRELDGQPLGSGQRGLRQQLRAWAAFARVFRHARPFFRQVFFEPMSRTDPSGRRIREAFKRMQLLSAKPEVAARPFNRFLIAMQRVHNHPVTGPVMGRLAVRLTGVDPEYLRILYTGEEFRRASTLDIDTLAEESLQAKYET
jgi:hypothetical protein